MIRSVDLLTFFSDPVRLSQDRQKQQQKIISCEWEKKNLFKKKKSWLKLGVTAELNV